MSLDSAVLDVLSRSVMPTTAAVLARLVKPLVGKGFKKEFLADTLAGLVSAGQIRAFALSPRKPAELSYSTASPLEITAQILRTKVHAAAKALKQGELRQKLPPALLPNFEAAFDALLKRQEIFAINKGGLLAMKRPPRPSDFLDPARLRTLRTLLTQVNSVRRSALTIDDFVNWLDAETAAPLTPTAPVPAKPTLPPTEELLREWYAQDRLRSSTQMIPIPQTWSRYTAWAASAGGDTGKEEFKSLLENLYNVGKVLLEPCERPQDLPEDERSLLVPLAIGPPGFAWSWMSPQS